MAVRKVATKATPKPKVLTGDAAIKEYQRQISPKGMASASAMQKKALEDKYPGMYKTTKPTPKPTPKTTVKPKPKPKPKPKKTYKDATDRPGFLFGKGTI